jgi:hypothetical protein
VIDLMEEDTLRRQLAQFRRSEEVHHHPSNALVYTPGVKFLAERCGLSWLIDLIAAWQWRALREPDLAIFQLWELRPIGTRRVLLCMRDSESLVFALPVVRHRSPLDYLNLYVEFGVLMLPSEKSKAPR